ncbi:MAG: sulfite exporter TauE/SafE family protein [Bacteroidetes bacterium]|nr:sulfite exporter TauE/SafE family protein [Bacteroidota bacterium]HET6243299.1 sulfite exporter TauE/SafE family protein [Bacteroidia bacterium]
MNFSLIIGLLFIGLVAGVLSGMIGIGGGIVIVPALVYFLGLTQHQSQGTSLLMMLPPIGVLAAINYYKSSHMQQDFKYIVFALILSAAFLIGGYIGSRISINIDKVTLQKVFGIILFVIAIKMFFFSK